MDLYDTSGRHLYLTSDERQAFIRAACSVLREVRTFCTVLHDTGGRVSEVLALTPQQIDFNAQAIVFETLKKRRKRIYRAVPVPANSTIP